jgi:hypothetical protein
MATQSAYLGNGLGYIYEVDPDGSTILASYANDAYGAQAALVNGIKYRNVGPGIAASGNTVISTVDAAGSSITSLTIGGISQITGSVVYGASSSANDVAVAIADAVNSHTAATDYFAVAISDTVYYYYYAAGDPDLQSQNASAISITDAGSTTYVNTSIDGATNPDTYYSLSWGRRFYLNANFTAGGACGGDAADPTKLTNAIEITNDIIGLTNNTTLDRTTIAISGGSLSHVKETVFTTVVLQAETGTTDDLDTLPVTAFSKGDVMYLMPDSGDTITIKASNNINTEGSNDIVLSDTAQGVLAVYDGTGGWDVIMGGYINSVASFRNAGFPFVSTRGKTTTAISANGTTTLTVNTDNKYHEFTNTVTLSGNSEIALSTTGAKAGDMFLFDYQAAVTIGGFTLTLPGFVPTAAEALGNKYFGVAYYDGSAWTTTWMPYAGDTDWIHTDDIADDQVTVDKVEDNLTKGLMVIPVSFETGELAANKVEMNFDGTIDKVYAIATKAIAATDDGTVTPKNNAGTTMTGGVITFTASDAVDTAYTASPTANNTFVSGDVLSFTTAKTTVGGKALVTIHYTKT